MSKEVTVKADASKDGLGDDCQSQIVYAYQVLGLECQEFVWLKYHFWLFLSPWLPFSRFLAHVLNWIKT